MFTLSSVKETNLPKSIGVFLLAMHELTLKYSRGKLVIHTQIEIEDNDIYI
jgi:hypothetical protein